MTAAAATGPPPREGFWSRLPNWAMLTAVLAVALAYPPLDVLLRLGQLDRVAQVLLLVMLAVGLNTVIGSAGLLDLGYVAFFAIGAYTAAYLTARAPQPYEQNLVLTRLEKLRGQFAADPSAALQLASV